MAQKRPASSRTPSSSVDGTSDQPRLVKRMRKGTKSCAECRRRKIKCIYDPLRPGICNDCFDRGATCVDQEHADLQPKPIDTTNSGGLKNRVSQLEDLVRTLVSKLDGSVVVAQPAPAAAIHQGQTIPSLPTPGPSIQSAISSPTRNHHVELQIDTNPHQSLPNVKKSCLGTAPILSLFDNSIVTNKGGWHEEMTSATAQDLPESESAPSTESSTRMLEMRHSLLSCFPAPQSISKMVSLLGPWSRSWIHLTPEHYSGVKIHSLEQFIQLSKTKGSLPALGKILLFLALSLTQMPSDYDFAALDLPLPPAEISDLWARQVHKLVLSNDDIVGTYEGIEALIIYAKFAMNVGRPRKAWLAHRRALTFAQLLNLHHTYGRAVESHGFTPLRKEYLWIDLVLIDKVLALFLGQPYTIDAKNGGIDDDAPHHSKETNYLLKLCAIAGRTIDRNQDVNQLERSLPVSVEIEQDLEELARSVEPSWSDAHQDPACHAQNGYLYTYFIHHQIRSFVHLPFMLRSGREERFHHNRVAAVESSRAMIKVWKLMRSPQNDDGAYICKMSDFQAFSAAIVILINLLGFSRVETQDRRDDWDLVLLTTDILRSSIGEVGGKVSAQCVQVLESFQRCRDMKYSEVTARGTKITIPFYGTLTIAPGKDYENCSVAQESLLTPPAGSDANLTSPAYIGFDSYTDPIPLDFGLGEAATPEQPQNVGEAAMSEPPPFDHWNPWPDMCNMDLDHDWNWYMAPTGI